jgi:hypothetical protein
MIKNFSIFKVTEKKSENQPDYKISAKIGEEFVEVGAGWIKDGKSSKYISCKLSDPYADHVKGTKRDGFHLAVDEMGNAKSYPVDKDEPNISLDDIGF